MENNNETDIKSKKIFEKAEDNHSSSVISENNNSEDKQSKPVTDKINSDDFNSSKTKDDENKSSLEKGYECKWEGCGEFNIEDIFTHIKTSHLKDQTQYKCMWIGCQKYNEVSVSKGGVYSHCRTHIPNLNKSQTGEKLWICQICKIEFSSMSVYYRHKKKHTLSEKKEETNLLRISALSRILESHKKNTKELLKYIHEKTLTSKFLGGEIIEIIKKYVKGTNCYTNEKSWGDYL